MITAEKCHELAVKAYDEMANHPEIWLTHGLPSWTKEQLIVGVIARMINEAVKLGEKAK